MLSAWCLLGLPFVGRLSVYFIKFVVGPVFLFVAGCLSIYVIDCLLFVARLSVVFCFVGWLVVAGFIVWFGLFGCLFLFLVDCQFFV